MRHAEKVYFPPKCKEKPTKDRLEKLKTLSGWVLSEENEIDHIWSSWFRKRNLLDKA